MYVTVMMIDVLTYGIIFGGLFGLFSFVRWMIKASQVKSLTKEIVEIEDNHVNVVAGHKGHFTKVSNERDDAELCVNLLSDELDMVASEAANWADEVVTVPVTVYKDITVRTRK